MLAQRLITPDSTVAEYFNYQEGSERVAFLSSRQRDPGKKPVIVRGFPEQSPMSREKRIFPLETCIWQQKEI
jgi:hypothetical protein